MNIHGFQAKWAILWPHSWHCLFQWSHIVHMGASRNSKKCCLREFSFSLHGKFIFHFPSAWNDFFMKDLPYICCKIGPNQFPNTRTYLMHNWPNGWVSKVLIHLWWKRQIRVDSAGSGSNLNCSYLVVCSLFFPKIISRYISIYLIRETSKVFQDSTTS